MSNIVASSFRPGKKTFRVFLKADSLSIVANVNEWQISYFTVSTYQIYIRPEFLAKTEIQETKQMTHCSEPYYVTCSLL